MKLSLVVLAALPIFGQGIVGSSSNFSIAPDGTMRGSATFQAASILPPAVLNAPYSGEQVFESVLTLADGTRITRTNPGPSRKIWRDAQGRVRTEHTFGPRRDVNAAAPVVIEIDDPVAGYVYVLDTVNKIAHRVHVQTRPSGAVGMRAPMLAPPPAAPPSPPPGISRTMGGPAPQSTTEQLGTKTIDGVLVSGIRTTTIIPEGAQGNDRPMTTTDETWMSNELRLVILGIHQSPMSGTNTTRYANFSTADPPPSLFMVPSDYSIVDEKDTFTIRWGQQ